MANLTTIERSPTDPYAAPDPNNGETTWSDYGKAFGQGALDIGGDLGALVRHLGESREDPESKAGQAAEYLGKYAQGVFSEWSDGVKDSLSDEAQKRITSSVSDPDFWSLSTLALKGAQTAPSIAAVVVPSIIFPGAMAATVAAASSGAAFSAGSMVDDVFKATDALSDLDLSAQVPFYRELRQSGVPEEEARKQYDQMRIGAKPQMLAVLGALTASFGPAGQVARGVAGRGEASLLQIIRGAAGQETERGLASRVAGGVAEGAISEGIQSTGESIVGQQAAVDGSLQDGIDYTEAAKAGAEGAVLGGVFGAGAEVLSPGHGRSHTENKVEVDPLVGTALGTPPVADPVATPAADPAVSAPVTTEVTPAVADPAAVSNNGPTADAVATPPVTDPKMAPASAPADVSVGPKGKAVIDKAKKVETVETGAPNEAELLALNKDKPVQVTPEVIDPNGTPLPEVPAAASPSPAPEAPVGATPSPEPAVAPVEAVAPQPAPVPEDMNAPITEPAPAPAPRTGPRILEDRTAPDQTQAWADRVGTNIQQAEAPVVELDDNAEETTGGKKYSTKQIEQRAKTNEGARAIFEDITPSEIDNDAFATKNVKRSVAARRAVKQRAQDIVDRAKAEGLTIPKAIRDSKGEHAYNDAVTHLVEANALAKKANPTREDYERFLTREVLLRADLGKDVKADRRSEGDTAMKPTGDIEIDTIAETTGDDTTNPEAAAIAADEARAASKATPKAREILTTAERRQAQRERNQPKPPAKTSEEIPASVARALDKAMGVKPEPAPEPVVTPEVKVGPKVEVLKRRKIAAEPKPAEAKPVAKVETTPEPKPAPKILAVKEVSKGQQIVKDINEKIAAAREKTNTAPTEAQKEAGNYAKGKLTINGMTIAIENPKGSERSGTAQNGRKWKSKLPADYGYIQGTKGVDGDHVDVYVGPAHDATYVYVVDQVDPDTRAFDEHKVLMGFKSEGAALQAYDKAFSDGSGMLRVGGTVKMTPEQFKEWVNSRAAKTEAAEVDQSDIFEALLNPDPNPAVTPEVAASIGMAVDPIDGKARPVISSAKAGDMLDATKLDGLSGAERIVTANAKNILAKLVPDVDVHVMSTEQMADIVGVSPERAPMGLHSVSGDKHVIYIREDQTSDPVKLRHVLLHEATHAASVLKVVNDRLLHNNVYALMTHVADAIKDMPDTVQKAFRYGLTQPREFIAEVFSNPEVQRVLQTIEAPEHIVKYLKLDNPPKGMNAWTAMISVIRRALGLPNNAHSMLEASIRLTEQSFADTETAYNARQEVSEIRSYLTNADSKGIVERATQWLKDTLARPDMQPTAGNPWALGLRTLDNIARDARRYFRGNDVVDRLYNAIEGRRTTAKTLMDKSAPMSELAYRLEKKYGKVPGANGESVFQNFTGLIYDETNAGVFADRPLSDQKFISAEGKGDAQKRARHPDLSARYEALPEDLKELRRQALEHARVNQEAIAKGLMQNRLLQLFDAPDPKGLADRIYNDTATDADKALLGDFYETIRDAGVMGKINGPYVALQRRGNYIAKGRIKIDPPANGTAVERNVFAFKSAKEASDWAAKQQTNADMRTVYVDKTTGERFGKTADGREVALTAQDADAVPSYRVTVQDEHMAMYDTMAEARAAVAEMRAKGMDADDAVVRSFENSQSNSAMVLSSQMQRMRTAAERRAISRNYTPEQMADLLQSINEAALALQSSSRVPSKSLPRRHVQGYSRDFTRNITDYAQSTANTRATIDAAPKIDKLVAEMDDFQKANPQDGFAGGRSAIIKEIKTRITKSNPASEGGAINNGVARILSLSFIDKLASPSYSVVNSAQPMMITTPFLAARYGVGKALGAMSRAYGEIGGLQAIKEGALATAQKARNGDTVPSDPVNMIRSRVSKDLQTLIDVLIARGSLDVDQGLEVGKLVRRGEGAFGAVDKGIGYLEGISRQMPKTIEAINRTVSAIAAYRLEMERSGDVDMATQYAQDIINQTQFNYSSTNTPPIMNHPLLRLALQFKKYGQGMYQLLGEQMALAYHNEKPGDRAQAIKTLSYTVGMHVLMAGAMGLPVEPIKLVVTAANGLGVIGWGWGDVEEAQRVYAAQLLGKTGGEMLTRGITRGIGIDTSSRMGIDTLMGPFGEPRSNEAQDWKAYMWDTFSGAPAGLIADWGKGINSLAQGDVLRATEQLVPIKAFSDSVKAYRTFTEGNVSKSSGRQTMTPYNPVEAIGKALGFAPAREAESYERQAAFYRGKGQQDEARSAFQKEWVDANGASRGRLWRDVQKWNKSQPAESRLSLSDLRGYQKKVKSAMKDTKDGIRARKREQHIEKRVSDTFNYQ